MRSYTRHQLKENAFAETTADTISWAVEHRAKVMAAVIVIAVVAAAAFGIWAFIDYRNQQASDELSGALLKYNAPIRPAGEPPSPEMLSYASSAERAKAANVDFSRIADKYSFTRNGRLARYFQASRCTIWGTMPVLRSSCRKLPGAATRKSPAWRSLPSVDRSGRRQDTTRYRDLQEPDCEPDHFRRRNHCSV